MNKFERRLKGYYKYQKRLKNYGLQGVNHYVLKSTGKPCSCEMCSPGKVEDKAKYQISKNKDYHTVRLY